MDGALCNLSFFMEMTLFLPRSFVHNDLVLNPALTRLAVYVSPQRRRRGIFVESKPFKKSSPIGAAYSNDVAPDGAWDFLIAVFYNDVSPTGFASQRRADG
jgi:hypothetical protein